MMEHPDAPLIVYGHNYCPQARGLRRVLDEKAISYEWRDVREGDPRFQAELKAMAGGFLSVPTVIFPDGTILVEPWAETVVNKMGAA